MKSSGFFSLSTPSALQTSSSANSILSRMFMGLEQFFCSKSAISNIINCLCCSFLSIINSFNEG